MKNNNDNSQELFVSALEYYRQGRLQKAEITAKMALETASPGNIDSIILLQAINTEISLRVLRDQYAMSLDNAWRNILSDAKYSDPKRLEQCGYKVYSQTDEDGIIDEIFRRIGTSSKKFIEFGVEKGLENNTLFLLYQGWKGLWIEADKPSCEFIRDKFRSVIDEGRLSIVNSFITAENINSLFLESEIGEDIDLLSIDIDGNDYHVFEAITCINPRVVVIEYNAKFPPHIKLVPSYNPCNVWNKTDYMGASLKSLELLGAKKGYKLVGTNISGVNAFFVREDLVKNIFVEPAIAENLYNPARYWLLHMKSGHEADFGVYEER
ncbi:MAG: hypothetical protein H6Q72_2853 [Firmicutes bacterium]|nr:hypothetical protein [Bacillota bacterium]